MMANPVLVELTRGGIVESFHHGSLAVLDADGDVVLALGDIDRPVFPRSAVKAFQSLPLIESGAADRFRLTDEEIALACASHSGEPEHVSAATAMLGKAGKDMRCLECGAHWPSREPVLRAMVAAGTPLSALHNNCSGKHAGFICLAVHEEKDTKGYVKPEHPVMREVSAALGEMTGQDLDTAPRGVDGCSIPTYGIPLRNLARGFARFGTGQGLSPERARAAKRIRAAVAAHSFMVAGTSRFDTLVMEALRERAFIKTGAEGVYCAALPEKGLGVAIKIDDGAGRASEAAMAAVIARFLDLDDRETAVVSPHLDSAVSNWNGIETGRLRATGILMA